MYNKKQQERYRRWFEMGQYWTRKCECPVCGSEFYAISSLQTVCGRKNVKQNGNPCSDTKSKNDE